jgi:hypothetical protein
MKNWGIFDQFHRHSMTILLGDFSMQVGREDIFKLTIGNSSLYDISNDSGVRVVNFATSKKFSSQKYNVPSLQHS